MVFFVDQVEFENFGQIMLVNFVNEKGFEVIGGNLFLEIIVLGLLFVVVFGEEGLGILCVGYLEESVVDFVCEIIEFIKVQCGYELNLKVIIVVDQMLGVMVQVC